MNSINNPSNNASSNNMKNNILTLHEEIINKIQEEKITPYSRRYFIVKNYVMWAFFICVIVLGSLVISIDIHLFQSATEDLIELERVGLFNFILTVIPYFWIIVTIAFITIACSYYRQFKAGYRHEFISIIITGFCGMFALGLVLHISGISRTIQQYLLRSSFRPYYQPLVFTEYDIWLKPRSGFFIGTVTDLISSSTVTIIDPDNKSWRIVGSSTFVGSLVVGDMVKIHGTSTPDGSIRTFIIKRW